MRMPKARQLTIGAVGDAESKKAELLIKYTYNEKRYSKGMPPIFINNVQEVVVDHTLYSVYFRNAETDDDYIILRHNIYECADCILLCYSISNRKTFESISKKWCVEIRKVAPFVPLILVATDTETRHARNSDTDLVSTEEAENLKYLIGAAALVECSVEKRIGIDEVFIEAIRSTRVP